MWTEAAIKQYLDGTFTRFNSADGAIVTVRVEPDYIPTHTCTGRQVGETFQHERYSADEDIIITELRRRRMPFWEIAERLDRTEESVKHRIRTLEGRK